PEDESLSLRLSNVREMLQPQELQTLRALQASAQPEAIPPRPYSPRTAGERLFVLGDYAGAAAAYRRALQERPDNELIRERLPRRLPPGHPTPCPPLSHTLRPPA